MKTQINRPPYVLAVLMAAAITGLTLTSLDSLARADDARSGNAHAAASRLAAPAVIQLPAIVVTAKRLPAAPKLATAR